MRLFIFREAANVHPIYLWDDDWSHVISSNLCGASMSPEVEFEMFKPCLWNDTGVSTIVWMVELETYQSPLFVAKAGLLHGVNALFDHGPSISTECEISRLENKRRWNNLRGGNGGTLGFADWLACFIYPTCERGPCYSTSGVQPFGAAVPQKMQGGRWNGTSFSQLEYFFLVSAPCSRKVFGRNCLAGHLQLR